MPRFRAPGRVACSLLLSSLIAALLSAVAAAAVSSGKYTGRTSEGTPVTLTVAAGGHAITHFRGELGYNGKCGPGGGPLLIPSIPGSIHVGANGSFGANVRLKLGKVVNDPGRVFGVARGSKVSGTIEQFLNGKVNRCYVESFTTHKG
ncbi:MAG: hypothetical protein ACYDC2_07185 [Solirubrobacteraceae bacterium]